MSIRADDLLLLEQGKLVLPENALPWAPETERSSVRDIGTVLSNFAYYGAVPSAAFLAALRETDQNSVDKAWTRAEALLRAGSGADRDMEDHVVYKNFPAEVLEMSEASYWVRQILMYLGLPNEIFTEEVADRAPLDETIALRVLELADPFERDALMEHLREIPAEWRPIELDAATAIVKRTEAQAPGRTTIDAGAYAFRTNAMTLAAALLPDFPDLEVKTTSATDVLRLAAGVSGQDVALKVAPRFASFKRPMRRRLIALLENAVDLESDFARRPNTWKHLLKRLHPGEFKAPRLSAAYDALYNGLPNRFAARLETALKAADPVALDILASDPGTFARDLTRAWKVFGRDALVRFASVLPELETGRLVQLERHFETLDRRNHRLVRPRGRWNVAKVIEMPDSPISGPHRIWLVDQIRAHRKARLDATFADGIDLDARTTQIKLPINGQELAPYGPGTEFPIPENVTFLRSASYWKNPSDGNTWFDNGWSFFDADWQPVANCTWDQTRFGDAAIFSGDPTNSKDLEGRGCQMIDLYLDRLAKEGVAYALWSVLCYSHIPFNKAEDVLATLQWGEVPEGGQLYEPSRAQMAFPIKGEGLARYIAYVDLRTRTLVSLDLELPGSVQSAAHNAKRMSTLMPAVMDHITSLPSVYDMFSPARGGSTPVRRDDENAPIKGPAWIFAPRHADSEIDPIDLSALRATRDT